MSTSTPAHKPREQPSDEGDKNGLRLAEEQGAAFQRTAEHMTSDIAEAGGSNPAGE